MGNETKTDFLTPVSTFLMGFGSLMSISGEVWRYNISETPEAADAKAIASDWKMVGQDIKKAIDDTPKATKEK